MKTIQFTFILYYLFCICKIDAQELLHIRNGCQFDINQLEKEVYAFPPSNEVQEIATQITTTIGLEQNFTIRAANVKNALATAENGQRFILYNTTFLENFKEDNKLHWAAYGVLAHEIGHHLNNHDFNISDPKKRRIMEIRADFFSGNVLQKLGASLIDAQFCINAYCLEGESETHPSRSARLEAVASGWRQSKDISIADNIRKSSTKNPENSKSSAEQWFEKGISEKNDNFKAIDYFDKAINEDPTYAEAYLKRGEAKEREHFNGDALMDFSKAIKLNPNYAEAYLSMAVLKIDLEKYEYAIHDLDQYIKLEPYNFSGHGWRGHCYNALEKYEEAIRDYNEAVRLFPDSGNMLIGRAWAYFNADRYTEALSDFNELVKQYGDDHGPEETAARGCCLIGMGDKSRFQEGINLINTALSQKPDLDWAEDYKNEALELLKN